MLEIERERPEPTAERIIEADFGGYRQVVDALNSGFRDVGILDAGGYGRAMRDPRTVRLRIGESVELPFLAPLEYVTGYDIDRTKGLTGQGDVYIMALPFAALTSQDVEVVRPESEGRFRADQSAILVETDHAETAEVKQLLPEAVSSLSGYAAADFLDERIRRAEDQPAMMAVYQTRFESVDAAGERLPDTGVSLYSAYEELVEAGDPLTERTRLIDVFALREDEALVEELWDLCKDRFEWLGDAHPVSMEDTKDFFLQVVLNEDTHTIVRYDDEDRPACLGFFMSGLEECSWMRQGFRDDMYQAAQSRDEQMLYFYGIASRSEGAAHYARDVMCLLAHIIHQRGGNYRLLFESTNMSSRYIPRMVSQYVGQGQGVRMAEPIQKTAQLDYWYLSPQPTAG